MYSISLTPILLVLTLLPLALAVAQLRRRLPHDELSPPKEIDALLPQSQCVQCGHPSCMPYAEAVAAGTAIDLCPPGGPELVIRLCNRVCPSEINLTEIFTQAKRVESWQRQDNDHKLAIKQRYAEHQDRAAQRTLAAQERRAERLQRRRSRPGRTAETQQQQQARPARAAAARNKHGRQV